jgi:CheY-like chemotaxis protein
MILIVEDDPLSRRALQFLLAANGYTSSAVGSAEEALDVLHATESAGRRPLASQRLPQMMLIDIDLPGMSGLELLKYVHSAFPAMPCMLMSANHGDLLEANPRGDDHDDSPRGVPFLPKPLDLRRVLSVVRERTRVAATAGQCIIHSPKPIQPLAPGGQGR